MHLIVEVESDSNESTEQDDDFSDDHSFQCCTCENKSSRHYGVECTRSKCRLQPGWMEHEICRACNKTKTD